MGLERVRYVILGAGPSGLSFAHALRSMGEESFLLLEKEIEPGGLCRSADVDGKPLDIGGGHFLDERRTEVLDFLFQFMPASEWNRFSRIARIRVRDTEIDHPIEANLWQLSTEDQLDFIESVAKAGSVAGTPMPEPFSEWIDWKLGGLIAGEYMKPYNQKLWSCDLSELSTYWLHKLPSVCFREVVESCLRKKACGTLPAHGTFLYPKSFGYGEVWKRMGNLLGDRLRCGSEFTELNIKDKIVNSAIQYELLVSTVPWPCWIGRTQLPPEVVNAIRILRHAAIRVGYHPENIASDAHWIYEPAERLAHHRLLLRHNFCQGAKGHWTETNLSRVRDANTGSWFHDNPYAYPASTVGKPAAMQTIANWATQHQITLLGRWGKWEHMNSDVAVAEALEAAKTVMAANR